MAAVAKTMHKGACPHDCPDTCAMIFEVENGKLTGVKGNPAHPMTRGGLCVKLEDYKRRHYHPDRLLYPMRRVGPKGTKQFERIDWDDALTEITEKWRGIISEYGPQAVVPYSDLGHQGLVHGLNGGDAFFNRLGATVTERTFCGEGAATAWLMTLGPSGGMDPESFIHSEFIIIWAYNSASTNLHHWHVVKDAQKKGAKVVVIDAYRSRTAKEADRHIASKPGTDGALAMAMIHTLINEDLVDAEYIRDHTHGYAELAALMGFEDEQFRWSDRECLAHYIDCDSPACAGFDLDYLRKYGFAHLSIGGKDDRVPHQHGNFPTPTGKCELVSTIAGDGNFVAGPFRQMYADKQGGEPLDAVPDYVPPRETPHTNPGLAQKYPLNIISPKSHGFLNSCYANMEQKIKGQGEQFVLIHADDAEVRGITDGDEVRVFNARGAFFGNAVITDDVNPGVVVATLGYWRQLAKGTVNIISSAEFVNMGHAPTFSDNLVDVAAA